MDIALCDSLFAIGARLGVDWQDLARLHGVVGPGYFIQPGQVLQLPEAAGGVGAAKRVGIS